MRVPVLSLQWCLITITITLVSINWSLVAVCAQVDHSYEGPEHDPVSGNYDYDPYYGFPYEPDLPRTLCRKAYKNPWIKMSVPDIIKSSGYDFEEHPVLSEDGYYVTTYRIPGGELSPQREGKIPVILNHGVIGSSMSWLFLPGNDSLAFKLANAGYDVFLMNARGSKVSQSHESLSTDDSEFWDFTFEELALYDIPALMDHITNITGMERMYYIGHSLATIQYSIMLSEKPHLASKILVGFLLAPAPYISGMQDLAFRGILSIPANYHAWKGIYGYSMGERTIHSWKDLRCLTGNLDCHLCENTVFFLFGHNMKQFNGSVAALADARYLDTTGTKLMVHVAQLLQSGKFRRFSYMNPSANKRHYGRYFPPKYHMDRIRAPTIMWWGYSDRLTVKEDVKRTYMRFSKGVVKENNRVQLRSFDHMDFLYGKDVNKLVYDRILWIMNTGRYVEKFEKGGDHDPLGFMKF